MSVSGSAQRPIASLPQFQVNLKCLLIEYMDVPSSSYHHPIRLLLLLIGRTHHRYFLIQIPDKRVGTFICATAISNDPNKTTAQPEVTLYSYSCPTGLYSKITESILGMCFTASYLNVQTSSQPYLPLTN